jgi:hypothetical protein
MGISFVKLLHGQLPNQDAAINAKAREVAVWLRDHSFMTAEELVAIRYLADDAGNPLRPLTSP